MPLPFGFLIYASCRISDQRIAFRAICSVDRIEPYPAIPNMDLEPVAIMLQFVRSARPLRRPLGDDRLTRTDESSRRIEWPATTKLRNAMPAIRL